ncbi:EscI/YscI/HrpB family type III secretion system inner rod protein [Paraburkholderia agricolaris]|uniref:EscI/YscI/HrpB family type III secretion system inner rod protein n=1 Tax=Paraburkholderia agricolaris TaxID=2152888 RepID=UPI0012919A8B|nr:EscI/YscI/HrpB family type III secretion system inner rod protein [Paraburkholderia agricolaris]
MPAPTPPAAVALTQQAIAPPASPDTTLAPVAVPPPPSSASIERFRNALTAAAFAPGNAVSAPIAATPGAATAGGPIGTRILNGLRTMSSSMETDLHQVSSAVTNGIGTLQEVMRAQVSLVSWSYQTELLTKSVAKASQDVDQLLRMQ